MVNDSGSAMPAEVPRQDAVCPWCSVALPVADAETCPSCGARLTEAATVEIPGLTAVDPVLLAVASAPRKVKRTFGSLFVGGDDEIPPPSEAEMPALARPDLDVRREILRLELEAQLASLKAEVAARQAEGASATANRVVAGSPPTEAPATPETGPGDGEPPARD